MVLLVATNSFFTSKYLNEIKQEGEIRLRQNERNIVNELQKNSVIPQFLVRDQSIWNALLSTISPHCHKCFSNSLMKYQ